MNRKVLIACLVAFLLGYVARHKSRGNAPNGSSENIPERSQVAPAGAEETTGPAPRSSIDGELRAADEETRSLPLSSPETDLLESADTSPLERAMKLALVLANHKRPDDPGRGQLGPGVTRVFQEEPAKTLEAIRSLLPKLSDPAFSLAKAATLDLAGTLAGQAAEVHRIAVQEMLSTVIRPRPAMEPRTENEKNELLSSNPAAFLPIVAHGVALKTAASPDDALDVTLRALRRQTIPEIQFTLGRQLLSRFPQYVDKVSEALKTEGVPAPLVSAWLRSASRGAPERM